MMSRKAKLTQIDTERLIHLVEGHPTLYDKRERNYRDVDVVNNIWESIANILGCNSNDVKTRWRSMKDTYKRKKRELKDSKKSGSGTSDIREPKWQWYKLLSFLDDFMDDDCTDSNMPSDREEEDDENDDVDPSNKSEVEGSTTNEVASTSRNKSRAPPLAPPKKRIRGSDDGSSMLAILEDTRARHQERQEQRDKIFQSICKPQDCDDMFMLSYAEQLKKLPDAMKSSVKLKIAQIFHKARFSAPPCPPSSSNSTYQTGYSNARSGNTYVSESPMSYPDGTDEYVMWNL